MRIVYQDDGIVRRTIHADISRPDEFQTHTQMDIEPLIERNKMLSETMDRNSTNKLLARVPMFIYEQSIHEDWDEDDWKRWLNKPENEPFRVWKGQV